VSQAGTCPNPLSLEDARALIGILAILDGPTWVGRIGPDEAEKLRARLERDGLSGRRPTWGRWWSQSATTPAAISSGLRA
jgi:hypothetical protein